MIPEGYSREGLLGIRDIDDFAPIRRVFEYQVERNHVFGDFVRASGRSRSPRHWDELTFLPIQAFKWETVRSGDWKEEMVFLSSGTGQMERSRHPIRNLDEYHMRAAAIFDQLIGRVRDSRHVVFMPFYEANPQSSLLSMMQHFIELSSSHGSCFATSEEEVDRLIEADRRNTVLWTVTFGLLDYLEKSTLKNAGDLTIIETGGFKGREQTYTREEIHSMVEKKWPAVKVLSEYGMCELQSQAYWNEGVFRTPSGLFCLASDVDDPFLLRTQSSRGQLNFIDLANADTCSFIATQDFGPVFNCRSFDVEGRLQASDLRGCNLMYQ